jgi:HlyD family secretion protein
LSSDSLELQKNQLEANLAKNEAMSAQQQAALAEANANEAEAKRQADRAAKLVATGAVAQSQVDQTKSTLDVSIARINSAKQSLIANAADHKALEAQIKDLELKLARTDVKSPVSGIISVRNARVGAIAVGSGQPLFTVIRDGAIEMKADVAENDILKLEPGQKVIMTVAGLRQPIKGEVRSIDPLIDGTTRLGTAKFLVKEPEKAKIGMYASAEVTISVHSAAALPLTAITAEQDGMYARKIENDVVKMIPVETGIQDGDFIEITKGLKIGDVVVEKAGAFVRDGDRVEPVMDDKTASN